MSRFLIVLILADLAEAHTGNRVYPFYELTDEMLEQIDLHDGLIDEWYQIGEPSMTLLDFTEEWEDSAPDPADLDFRIWLAWHDEPARLYVAFVATDDVYKNTHDYSVDWSTSLRDNMYSHDGIMLGVDGDHGGGEGCSRCSEDEWLKTSGLNQRYEAVARTNGPNLDDTSTRFYTGSFAWTALPPYGESGGGVAGESPFISVIELYVTPFDQKGDTWDSAEGAVISDLAAGQIVGFTIAVNDYDPPDIFWMFWAPEADTDSDRFFDILGYRADGFLDGILMASEAGGTGESAVGSISWGRIKASLEK